METEKVKADVVLARVADEEGKRLAPGKLIGDMFCLAVGWDSEALIITLLHICRPWSNIRLHIPSLWGT